MVYIHKTIFITGYGKLMSQSKKWLFSSGTRKCIDLSRKANEVASLFYFFTLLYLFFSGGREGSNPGPYIC